MIVLGAIFLILNGFTEYIFTKMLLSLETLNRKHKVHHGICTSVRFFWVILWVWFAVPTPVFLMGIFVLLFVDIGPYSNRRYTLNNMVLVLYLIYVTLLMISLDLAGLAGWDISFLRDNRQIRILLIIVVFLMFNIIGSLLLYYQPDFMWGHEYNQPKVVLYTRFLTLCAGYYVLDGVILTLCEMETLNYVLLLSGDVLIFFLIYNFSMYNFEFVKSVEAERAFEESEIMVAQQYFQQESLKKLSQVDPLTKAYNRREISAMMEEVIQKGHGLVCAFVDLDGLKHINDTYGHSCGDRMLQRFAEAGTRMLGDKGYLARIGGDEFLLVFLDQEAADIETRIQKSQRKLMEPTDEQEKVSFSYGISYEEESIQAYIENADRRMYENKKRKRHGDI